MTSQVNARPHLPPVPPPSPALPFAPLPLPAPLNPGQLAAAYNDLPPSPFPVSFPSPFLYKLHLTDMTFILFFAA
jgi:hypothetical protein